MRAIEYDCLSVGPTYNVCLVPEPGARFRLLESLGVTIAERGAQGPYEGVVLHVGRLPDGAATHLPFQPEGSAELLDQHLPPDQNNKGIRSTGEYSFRLTVDGGGVVKATHGVFLEYIADAS